MSHKALSPSSYPSPVELNALVDDIAELLQSSSIDSKQMMALHSVYTSLSSSYTEDFDAEKWAKETKESLTSKEHEPLLVSIKWKSWGRNLIKNVYLKLKASDHQDIQLVLMKCKAKLQDE